MNRPGGQGGARIRREGGLSVRRRRNGLRQVKLGTQCVPRAILPDISR